jgi:CheY-like chemotaxis protein
MAILIVEDNRSVLTLLIETLHRGGHEVLAVVDGQEALAELRSRIPAMVLLDLDLPKVGGYEVLKQIRQ